MTLTKQMQITTMVHRGVSKLQEDVESLQRQIELLKKKLKEKQDETFEKQRDSLPLTGFPLTKKSDPFVKPQKIVLSNSVEGLKADMGLTSTMTGVEVKSYEAGDHCCVVFHMQHDSEHDITHGLRIDMHGGANVVSNASMPLGFDLEAVLESYDNIMIPECLGSIRKALVAYYDRLQQFDDLKKFLHVEAQMFKKLDATHMEILIDVQNTADEDEEQATVMMALDYRVYDIRPKQYSFQNLDNLCDNIITTLQVQCAAFKKKSLRKAFKEVFVTGAGPYKLVQQMGADPEEQQLKAKLLNMNKNYNNDDTFRPEDCSGASDGEDE